MSINLKWLSVHEAEWSTRRRHQIHFHPIYQISFIGFSILVAIFFSIAQVAIAIAPQHPFPTPTPFRKNTTAERQKEKRCRDTHRTIPPFRTLCVPNTPQHRMRAILIRIPILAPLLPQAVIWVPRRAPQRPSVALVAVLTRAVLAMAVVVFMEDRARRLHQ